MSLRTLLVVPITDFANLYIDFIILLKFLLVILPNQFIIDICFRS